ncbi:hypothetical protein T484DRAFT_1894862 [Baffinella frigidus]|nr:hypothetical protein T484DRAFT_1894862 [Cryptophyta sp. CCMP2293]
MSAPPLTPSSQSPPAQDEDKPLAAVTKDALIASDEDRPLAAVTKDALIASVRSRHEELASQKL